MAVDLDGVLYKMEPEDDEIEVKDKFEVGKKVVCIPAFHKGKIILRTADNELICLEAKP